VSAPALATVLRTRVQAFVRGFGLLREAETPCGKPIATSHAHALMWLLEQEAAAATPRQKELADALGLDKSNVARLCRRMELAGHVAQGRSEVDGRARTLALTAVGRRLASEVQAASLARFGEVLASIPRRERARVLAALEILNGAVAAAHRGER
jgi:DNA-binding MarR family transcriptional regulator